MVKTRSTRDHSGEDTYDTEITSEYSDEYDQADATVIKRPNKSQSVPALSSRMKKRVSRNLRFPSTVHRETMPSSRTLHGAPDSPDKTIQNNNMGLLEGITTVMRGMMSEVVQVMRNMTESIISSIHGHAIPPVKPLTRKSHRGMSSVPSAIRPTRKMYKDQHLSPSDSDSSCNSTMSDKSSRTSMKTLESQRGNNSTVIGYPFLLGKRNGKRQYNEESVQYFAAELKMLYDKGYPHRDKRTRHEDLLRILLLGLQDENARMHVELNREPESIEEAVYFTIHYQETCRYPDEDQYFTKGFNNRSRKLVRQIQQQNNNVPQNMDRKICFNCDQVGHFYRQCLMPRKFRNSPNQNGGQRTNFPPPFQPRPNNSNYRPEPSFNLNAPDFTSKPDPLN
ncbi:unnamed protein product [Mytilus coruscus]|uniref:CCHC-type domain-containing protein n=1 Tax=Mytilus coruscus TaxID=42192 RepID=A0A6J8CT77_MYTCO|nr:unnamed protein product [Mytilus coruscus]